MRMMRQEMRSRKQRKRKKMSMIYQSLHRLTSQQHQSQVCPYKTISNLKPMHYIIGKTSLRLTLTIKTMVKLHTFFTSGSLLEIRD